MTIVTAIKIAAAAAAAAALLSAAARADDFPAGRETVTSGGLSATLSWDRGEFGPQGTSLEISRDGVVAFARRIPDVVCDGCLLSGGGADDVRITDLDGDGDGEVLVTGYTGGQHCCTLMGIYDFRPASGTYGELVQNWLSSGFESSDLDHDGATEIVSDDLRFVDLFTSHAGSFPPVAVFAYKRPGGVPRLTDVTADFPALIRSHARVAKRSFARLRRGEREAGGFVSAYVADQYLLGRGSVGVRELDRQIARGILGRPPAARAYRRRLLALLHRYGYR